MTTAEMFDSAVRSIGDRAGVFEYDGETGYFYLCDTNDKDSHKIIGAIRIIVGDADFFEDEVAVRWDMEERRVGLFIRGNLWAVFDARDGSMYGGGYSRLGRPAVPTNVESGFIAPS